MRKTVYSLIIILCFSCNGSAQKSNDPKESKSFKVSKTDSEWKASLTDEQYYVLRKSGTEPAFSSPLNDNHEKGTFVCAGCGASLFKSEHKFDSGTGWPSFDREIKGNVDHGRDTDLGFVRDELHCAICGGHLGHVFDDGPRETTGKRLCINGDALKFVPEPK